MRVSMKDIAKAVGVSQTTVSMVLGNNKNCYASEKTKEKIFKVVREMGYIPNFSARILQGQPSRTIGLVTSLTGPETHSKVVERLIIRFGEKGLHVLMNNVSGLSPENKYKVIMELLSRRVDALVIGETTEEMTERIPATVKTIMLHALKVHPERENFCQITVDREHGGWLATDHLLKSGRSKPAFLGFNVAQNQAKISGYRRAVAEHCGSPDDARIYCPVTREKVDAYLSEMVDLFKDDVIDSCFCSNDYIAAALIHTFLRHGIRVPEDFAVVGFDDLSVCESLEITSVHQPLDELADAACSKITAVENDYPGDFAETILLKPELVVRSSTES